MLHEAKLKGFNARLDAVSTAIKNLNSTVVDVNSLKKIAEDLASVGVALTDKNFEDANYIDNKLAALEKALF